VRVGDVDTGPGEIIQERRRAGAEHLVDILVLEDHDHDVVRLGEPRRRHTD
jgi:hypothetical protein